MTKDNSQLKQAYLLLTDQRVWTCLDVCQAKSVIILGVPRTGSSLLSSYIGSLKVFENYGEILNPQVYGSLNKVLNLPFNKQLAIMRMKWILNNPNNTVMIKLLAGHLNKFKITLEDLHKNFPLAKYIIIYRSSLINCYVSFLMAKQTKAWSSRKSLSANKTVSLKINKDEFIEFCNNTKQTYFNYHSAAILERSLIIQYEQLADDPQTLFKNNICSFLGTSNHPVSSPFKKQIQTPLEEIVANWDDLTDIVHSPLAILQFNPTTQKFY